MSSNESDPAIKKRFSMPRWVVTGLSAVAFAGALAGCDDKNASRTYIFIPPEAKSLGMNYVGVPGLKFEVPAAQEEKVDCGYRSYFENPSERLKVPEYIPNTKGVDRSNPDYPIVVCQGTSADFVIVQPHRVS